MSLRNASNTPELTPLIFATEKQLHAEDLRAKSKDLILTDSAIRSLLVRAVNVAKGKVPKSAPSSEKDRFLDESLQKVLDLRNHFTGDWELADGSTENRPLPPGHWIAAWQTVKDSCEVRSGSEPGSRGYLDFLPSFLSQADALS